MATLTVGSGGGFDYSTVAAAIAASADGDVIQVQAGTYTNDFATITTSITIEGVGGMVNLVATQPPPNLQAILTIGTPGGPGPNVTLNNMAFSGASIDNSDGGNGAGIRYKSGNLTLDHTYFHDNQEGLLADADPAGTITIRNSEFGNNGNPNPPPGVEHNLYIGAIQQLTIDNSYFYNPIVGHNIKSRAANTTIENSRIDDPNGTGSYEIDLPNGGVAVIKNNIIEKGANAQNPNFIAYGEEGLTHPTNSLSVTGNTALNDHGSSATFVANSTTTPVSVTDNTLYGLTSGQVASGPVTTPENNTLVAQSSEPALDTSAPYLPVLPFTFACFAAGTRIMTTVGYVAVEALRPGHQALVAGTPQEAVRTRPVVWIGHRLIDLTRHPDPDLVRPIRIAANAFSDNEPLRDLLVSPDHAIAVGGLLIPARLLLNGATITRDTHRRTIRYFHIELDRHDILFADGLPAESYLDCGNRGVFENAEAPLELHPDLSAAHDQARRGTFSCAPFATDVARVSPVWAKLAQRAVQRGHTISAPVTTDDPALCLLVDGRVRPPASHGEHHYVFTLSACTHDVRLLSRSTKPCNLTPWVDDQRSLGVAVKRIVSSGKAGVIEIPVDAPFLTDGWWDAERNNATIWRWTNGQARLPLPPGVTEIKIHLAGGHPYLLPAGTTEDRQANVALNSETQPGIPFAVKLLPDDPPVSPIIADRPIVPD